jgi:spore germination protein YaaH
MKRVFSILMVAFAMTAMVACGDKVNGTDTPGDDTPTGQTDLVPEGRYYHTVTNSDEVLMQYYQLSVVGDYFSYGISKRTNPDAEMDGHVYAGYYQYSNATHKGTVDLSEIDENGGMTFTGKGEFTVDGENLTMEFLGETVTMTRLLD